MHAKRWCLVATLLASAAPTVPEPTWAGTLEVTAAAAASGAFGLEATLGPGCSSAPTVLLEPPPSSLSGDFAACEELTAAGVEIVSPGATLFAGQSVELENGFSVGAGADLQVGLTGEASSFASASADLSASVRTLRVRFAVNLDGLALAPGERVDLLVGESEGAPSFAVSVQRSTVLPENRLLLSTRLAEGSVAGTPFGEEQLLPSGWLDLEVVWQAAAGNGLMLASVAGGPFLGLAGLDNDPVRVDRMRLGLIDGEVAGSSGSIALDDFHSWQAIGGAEIAGCPIFPFDGVWSAPVDHLPVHPLSSTWIATIGETTGLHPDFGSGEWPPGSGAPIGIPWVDVPASQLGVSVTFLYDDESDPGPYPIPADPPIEGGPSATGDRHVLVVDRDDCELYELFGAHPQVDGSWTAGSGAIFDLLSHGLRPAGWTSADAAGLPILPGLIRYEEVAAGEIRHALRFTVPQTRREYVWPGRHYASSLTGDEYPPMGQRFRLRADFDLDDFSPEVRVILQALKTYGMLLADNGSAWYLSGAPDEAWDNDVLRELRDVTGADFEAVDSSSLIANPNSGQAAVEVQMDDFESGDLSGWNGSTP